jgi:hypothetical protein
VEKNKIYKKALGGNFDKVSLSEDGEVIVEKHYRTTTASGKFDKNGEIIYVKSSWTLLSLFVAVVFGFITLGFGAIAMILYNKIYGDKRKDKLRMDMQKCVL